MTVETVVETTQYLTFTLDGELFAFDISQVREVLDFTTPTKVPQTPDYMRGVINLRGNVVPVIDLRRKFGMPQAVQTVHSCIIIVEVVLEGETVVIGAMADAVQEVLDLEPDQIEPPPRLGTKLDTSFIVGMGKNNDDFIIILDIDRVFAEDELGVMKEIGEGAQFRVGDGAVQAVSA
ncbi:chemotaxis protein CheW [Geomesophilobacter sediminis]|uniref:Purine-binding chemotaxis protein CheW n=1 Tax=Geomesophilobacter sediminis TaxID=2798584 RepID=A0A8J7JGC0_9BACT|nr:chemotaxis protein CheW [Geomesophilobacter sediminis]MBJ6723540.1 purine-binding chemotaxis protein CheW [Geomesophilobacter sediminis]